MKGMHRITTAAAAVAATDDSSVRGEATRLLMMALPYMHQLQFEEARVLLEKALEVDPRHLQALRCFGAMREQQGTSLAREVASTTRSFTNTPLQMRRALHQHHARLKSQSDRRPVLLGQRSVGIGPAIDAVA